MQNSLAFCFDELSMQKVFLRTAPGNISSLCLAQKFGFEKEGLLKKEFRTSDDQLVDLLCLGFTASCYKKRS
ncbi:MAG: GNAT family N-acetyltransferase [Bacteroidia bacterium]